MKNLQIFFHSELFLTKKLLKCYIAPHLHTRTHFQDIQMFSTYKQPLEINYYFVFQ